MIVSISYYKESTVGEFVYLDKNGEYKTILTSAIDTFSGHTTVTGEQQ